jgi:predicted ATP-grasp superfamily ATP-dependent carboligase
LEAVIDIVRRRSIDILLGVDEKAIVFLGEHYSSLSSHAAVAPIPSPSTVRSVSDKSSLARFLDRSGVRFPSTEILMSTDTVEQEGTNLRFPVLLKPVRSLGGKGIRQFDAVEALRTHLRSMKNTSMQFILQEAIDGFDIDCSVLAKKGEILAYTVQKWWFPPTSPFGPPAGIQFVDHDGALNVARKLCSLLAWDGVMHIDMRWDNRDSTVKVLEINPRYWSSLPGSVSVGVNFPYLHCLLAKGEGFALPHYRTEGFLVQRRVALKCMAQNVLRSRLKGHVRFNQTSLKHTIEDPVPDIVNVFKGDAIYANA